MLLNLKEYQAIENNLTYELTDFCLLLDICFEISDYFTLTVHEDEVIGSKPAVHDTPNIFAEERDNFFKEMQPFLIKNIKPFFWIGYGVLNPNSRVYIFRCDKQAKFIIQKYFDNVYLQKEVEGWHRKGSIAILPQDLCFFIKNNVLMHTVSHEHMCAIYPPNEEIKNRLVQICEWYEFEDYESPPFPIENILFGAEYKTNPIYLLLQSIRIYPQHCIREKSLIHLCYFIRGYCLGINKLSAYILAESLFNEFVRDYYGIKYQGEVWNEIILENSGSDAQAFDKFFELLDEFLNEKWQLIKSYGIA